MKRLLPLILAATACASQAQPSFREKFNALAAAIEPSLMTRECTSKPSFAKNRDVLIECLLKTDGANLLISALNNRFTSAIMEVHVPELNRPSDLMKAVRVFLRLSRNKERVDDDLESTQLVIEAQGHLGRGACEDVPDQQTRFCVLTRDKKIYMLGIFNPALMH